MKELARPVGIGFAGQGKVSDVVEWARTAQQRGIHIVWMHDTPYQRDAVTYASAIAAQVSEIDIGLAAVSVYTRHSAVIGMTVSALDQMAPGRIRLGLGTTIPLRLAQMGIPYDPKQGVERVSWALDFLRSMWAGEHIPSVTPNYPPIQPMFPPVHHVPLYIAAYRTPFLQLAGRKADGYLSRPAESIPNLRRLIAKLRAASLIAGRDEYAIDVAGYLLTYVDKSRRAALNRAKREPFVIYMISVLSNFSMQQAGFDPELRDRIAAAWRAENYHKAAELMPDNVLDAFMLCGTAEEVAERAACYNQAGMDTPILQPVVQEDSQVQKVIQAATIYGSLATEAKTSLVPRQTVEIRTSGQEAIVGERLNQFERIWRQFGALTEIARPFSLTGAIVPVVVAGALAFSRGSFQLTTFIIVLAASVLLQIGSNIINEIYDVRHDIDEITSPRSSHALLKGRITEKRAFRLAAAVFTLAILMGFYLIALRGWPLALLGGIGVVAGYSYTAPPLQFKYKAAGVPLVFSVFGPLMTVGSYYAITGTVTFEALILSLPIGLLITAVLHGNEWRDISDDARYGVGTISTRIGRKWAYRGYIGLVTGAYLSLVIFVLIQVLPVSSLLALLSLPWLMYLGGRASLGLDGQQRAIAKIDIETAKLHAVFGLLLGLGLLLR
jgi:1,4-dihydroxy-2-naphthoate octaprenyltransferase